MCLIECVCVYIVMPSTADCFQNDYQLSMLHISLVMEKLTSPSSGALITHES